MLHLQHVGAEAREPPRAVDDELRLRRDRLEDQRDAGGVALRHCAPHDGVLRRRLLRLVDAVGEQQLARRRAEPHGLREIGVTGYPERHSFIEDDLTIQAMWDKRRIATYIVSNLCFDPRLVKKWVARVRRRGVELPVHVGLAGVADPAKLLRVSTRIGLADSARFLRGHSNWFMRMLQPGGYDPERFATGLLPDLAAPERKVAGLHFFTFNEIEATEHWRQETMARLLAA